MDLSILGLEQNQRVILEYVPGMQVTIAHILAKPDPSLFDAVGLIEKGECMGVMTITPGEGAIVACDIAMKISGSEIGLIDRFYGALILIGKLTAVETAMKGIMNHLGSEMGYAVTNITKS